MKKRNAEEYCDCGHLIADHFNYTIRVAYDPKIGDYKTDDKPSYCCDECDCGKHESDFTKQQFKILKEALAKRAKALKKDKGA